MPKKQSITIPHVTVTQLGAINQYLDTGHMQQTYSIYEGLKRYKGHMEQALDQQEKYYYDSQAFLQPFAATAQDTMNEMRQFLGMSPVSPQSSVLATRAQEDLTEGQETIRAIDEELASLEKFEGKYLSDLGLGTGDNREYAQRIYDELVGMAGSGDLSRLEGRTLGDLYGLPSDHPFVNVKAGFNLLRDIKEATGSRAAAETARRARIADLTEKKTRAEEGLVIAQEAFDQFKVQPSAARQPSGLTPEQKLRQTPGYQFRFQEGLEALTQTQAARGLRGSGEAIEQAIEYGQGLAGTYFDQHMAHLSGLLGQTAPAAMAQSNLAAQQGTNVSNMLQAMGGTQLAAQQAIGASAAARGVSKANIQADVAKHNAALATSVVNTLLAKQGVSTSTPSAGSIGAGMSAAAALFGAGPASRASQNQYNPAAATGYDRYGHPAPMAKDYGAPNYPNTPRYVY